METTMMETREYKSLSARQAREMDYGDESYWNYLDEKAAEYDALGVENAYTESLGEALAGNDGN